MSTLFVRWIFAALCGAFFFSIGGVAAWEWIRFRRGQSALSPRHFRWRMLSALTWLIVLGSFFIATAFLWPQSRADIILARRFLFVSSGALVLMMLAFALMAVDMFWTVQVGRRGVQERTRERERAMQRTLETDPPSDGTSKAGTNGHFKA